MFSQDRKKSWRNEKNIMISVIGIGDFCCLVVDKMSKYPQYNKLTISTADNEDDNHIKTKIYGTAEEYEKNCPDIKKHIKSLKNEVSVFLDGSEPIAGIILALAEQIKNKNISIYYIRSDIDLMSDLEKKQDKICFFVLQEYARSGLFNKICLIDKLKIEAILGEVPLIRYDETLSNLISSTVHMCNVYENTKPIMDNLTSTDTINRVCTIGIGDLFGNQIKWFYNLENIGELMSYYAINKATLEGDPKLLQKIKKQIKNEQFENRKVMFGIYETNYAENFVYCVARTKFIQQARGT